VVVLVPTDDRCDMCGRPAPRGKMLHSGTPVSQTNLIGRYGSVCARKVLATARGLNLDVHDDRGRLLTVVR
jgi:hypothetical protein